jgi:hypothetical protein
MSETRPMTSGSAAGTSAPNSLSRPAVESTLFRARRRLESEYEEIADGRRCKAMRATLARMVAARERVEALAPFQQQHQLLEEVADLVGLVALDGDLVAPDVDRHAVERRLDHAQQLVALTEQIGHEMVAGNGDLDLRGRHEGHRLLLPGSTAAMRVAPRSPGRPRPAPARR